MIINIIYIKIPPSDFVILNQMRPKQTKREMIETREDSCLTVVTEESSYHQLAIRNDPARYLIGANQ